MQSLSRIRLRRIQLFTVLSGAPMRPATCVYVMPSKYASIRLLRGLVKLVETIPQPLGISAERRQIGRARRRVFPSLHDCVVQWRLASTPPQNIEASVADDAGEPRHRRAATRVEAVGLAPDQDEQILHDILGQVATTENTERQTE